MLRLVVLNGLDVEVERLQRGHHILIDQHVARLAFVLRHVDGAHTIACRQSGSEFNQMGEALIVSAESDGEMEMRHVGRAPRTT